MNVRWSQRKGASRKGMEMRDCIYKPCLRCVPGCLPIDTRAAHKEHAQIVKEVLGDFTDAEVNAEFKRRNPPPPNPGAPTMKGKT